MDDVDEGVSLSDSGGVFLALFLDTKFFTL